MSDELESDGGESAIIPVEARRVTPQEMQMVEIAEDAPHDNVADILLKLAAVKAVVREVAAKLEAEAAAWIAKNGKVRISPTVFYDVGESSSPDKCLDVGATWEAAMEATGGDLEGVKALLASQAFKPGATKKALPAEVYEKLFDTKKKQKLVPSEAAKRLRFVNLQFAK